MAVHAEPLSQCMEEFQAFVDEAMRSHVGPVAFAYHGIHDGIIQFALSDQATTKTYTFDITACEARAASSDTDCLVAFFSKHITRISRNDDDPRGEIAIETSSSLMSLGERNIELFSAVWQKLQLVDTDDEPIWNRVMSNLRCNFMLVRDESHQCAAAGLP